MTHANVKNRGLGWGGVLWRVMVRDALAAVFVGAVVFVLIWGTGPAPRMASEIFRGVTYECRQLNGEESSGLAHLIRIDLKEPGIELYMTPKDPGAAAAGKEYVTRWAPRVARQEGLAVAVNAVLFKAHWSNAIPGRYASALETAVADYQVNHKWKETYLIWFEEDLTPHAELVKPPGDDILRKARWAVGSQIVLYNGGKMNPFAGHARERRTLIGIDEGNKLLYLGVFDDASGIAATEAMAEFGARQIMALDGGSSTALTFGAGGKDVPSGAVVYPLRALPTFFGVRAKKI